MTRVLVWDLPIRLFHWLLTASFLGAFTVALLAEEGPLFPLHSAFGLTASLLVAFRVVWGIVGSTTSRFSALTLSPTALVAYVREVLAGGGASRRWIGHNPGASWTTVAVLAGIAGSAATGVGAANGFEVAEELHELFAWGTAGVVLVHVTGVALHTVRHRENIAASMIDGRREGPPGEGIRSARPLVALALVSTVGLWAGALFASFDAAAGTLTVPILGTTLSIGEAEGEQGEGFEEEEQDDD